MARTSKSAKSAPPRAHKAAAASTKPTKKPQLKKAPPTSKKIIYHTDDGTPIINATMAQIRKGLIIKGTPKLVRIPQIAERSKLYAETAKVIGEREALALPYHGGRIWKCEVRVSDANGASGDNRIGRRSKANHDDDFVNNDKSPAKKNSNKSLTPLFRWYRGSLILATLPYILDDIIEVSSKMDGKKRWVGLSDDELDSSDDEYDNEMYVVEPTTKIRMEVSALTTSAYEDSNHPMPTVTRSWISPDLQRFHSRKSAMAHAEELVKRDLLIDRTLYGYGHNGVRLRPVKPTRKAALEAGMARFVRDGLWVVGQEEMWIEKRRDILVKKQERRLTLKSEDESSEESIAHTSAEVEGSEHANNNKPNDEDVMSDSMPVSSSDEIEKNAAAARAFAGYTHPNLDAHSCTVDSKPVVSSTESDASTEGALTPVKRAPGTRPPPDFTPSTHYRLNQDQIMRCHLACMDHYEKVIETVKARSLQLELADGFDVFRERGRGRYDMELPLFDTNAFSFLTDCKRAPWMPIVHKILGEDSILVHKGCFLSLPGSEKQVYHQDGVHLNQKVHKPCYAINVFIPLVDYDAANGPTEFCLGTHYLGHENFVKENAYMPLVKAGTPIIFDYRLGHRGLANFSQEVRPVVYLTYSSVASGKEFRDSVNFSRRRYHKLGEFVEKPMSREERAKRRVEK
ncbi:hypothetical protein ACHAWU_004915 [Discostella pseudostelligera]|uniref:Phytanoyl-CoA dioxygenase n=1 Tax=Discostella pseudostelligera TaxID=259834 RepID=A0ABD3ME88_9STRA